MKIRGFYVLVWLISAISPTFCLTGSFKPQQALKAFNKAFGTFGKSLIRIPLVRAVYNTYDFWYWLPRRNLPYDRPWKLLRNNTAELLAYFQFPHNLPPYRYLGTDHPDDFFCFGLPGNTLPLGDWDPWGLQQVSEKVVRKYR